MEKMVVIYELLVIITLILHSAVNTIVLCTLDTPLCFLPYRNAGMGNGLHGLQVQIAMRGSFCSLSRSLSLSLYISVLNQIS